ncbi:dsDNA nuclease domain-containing protein [Cellvibrio sp. NN19]|uniref:dsDNA nuclease domain-containing protein n=1 Tax=Cellvibrio chitinivorans TaxID=3102792 RepID=UPI002B40C436|nr:dsDNA nuclease domain-containing protein [Cellvibrio sp. NN19]
MANTDIGGIGAKKGFLYQDYVAALNTLFMLKNKNIKEVRCEVGDDFDVIYADHIEYVQVKTTASDKSWQLTEFTKCTQKKVPTARQGKEKTVAGKDSILHKSLNCDKEPLSGHFRIVTPRDVYANLSFLKILQKDRNESHKDQRNKLLKSLRSKLKTHVSHNGNDVEYWLDNATWEVIPSVDQVKLLAYKTITTVAYDFCGVHLNPGRDPERILNDLLVNIIEKSATSIVLKSVDSKTYKRTDFMDWFKSEVEYYSSEAATHLKVYTLNGAQLTAILDNFFTNNSLYRHSGPKTCNGVKGKYHRQNYMFDQLSKGIKNWIPEVLLRPSEIADIAPERLEQKIKLLAERKAKHSENLQELVSQVLLHSLVRTNFKAQPIPAHLYIDDEKSSDFDNVHIILREHDYDLLLMGFSHFIQGDIGVGLEKIVSDFDELLASEAFSNKKEKILEHKENGYLLQHDIDDILKPNTSLDENLSRFIFAFFIGYETPTVGSVEKRNQEEYLPILESEVTAQFQALIDGLIAIDSFFEEINVLTYIYPTPSLNRLLEAVKSEVA